MAHIAKYQSGAIGHMCALYENEAMQANGYNLGPQRSISQVQFIGERIFTLALKRHVRKDAVRLCDCIVTLPRSFDDSREREFFKTAYTFLSQRYGVDNVVSAYVHRNSSRPHMHFAWVPVTKDGRLSAKNVVTRLELDLIVLEEFKWNGFYFLYSVRRFSL